MPPSPGQNNLEGLNKYGNIGIAVGVVGVLVAIIIPLPTGVIDLMLTFNIGLSIMVLLSTIYIDRPLDLSSFPTLLLFTTLLRLSLNVATTRRILLDGTGGKVIEAFGQFVVGGNYVVGCVIFIIMIVLQFVVITKGSGRIAEVTARFTLDAMPGKQMAIDADLNSGLITEDEAKTRRKEISDEANFYGAMDGASKFVRGDATAGIIITFINVLGGFAIGMLQKGMDAPAALQKYTLLTIGDGLVAQIPSLIIATASGILVSRSGGREGEGMGGTLAFQLLNKPQAVFVTAGVLFLFGVMPGLPTVPFFVLSGALVGLGYVMGQAKAASEEEPLIPEEEEESSQAAEPDRLKKLLYVDPMEIEIGYGLIPLVDAGQGGDLLDRITSLRRQFVTEMGFVVPPIRIRDNLQLRPDEYAIKINGVRIGGGELMMNMFMALDTGVVTEPVEGLKTIDPSFGLEANWITENQKERAEAAGYTVVDAQSVLVTHLTEVIKSNSHELLSRQAVQELLDNLKNEYPVVVEELVPNLLTVGAVQRVLQNLLRENVPIRNLAPLLETLADYAPSTKDTDILSEYVRHALAGVITRQYASEDDSISVIMLDPRLEQMLNESTKNYNLVLDPETAQAVVTALSRQIERVLARAPHPIVLCTPMIRLAFKKFIEQHFKSLIVLSYSDLLPNVQIKSLGVLSIQEMPELINAGV
jgi:flagellar biosynthesis protein FlhA